VCLRIPARKGLRMLVSTSAATGVEILALPAAVATRAPPALPRLAPLLALGRRVEQAEPRLEIQGRNVAAGCSCQ
jgi:hypothetical protein